MSFPEGTELTTVVGQYLDARGRPAKGAVTFRPDMATIGEGISVVPIAVRRVLDSEGKFSVQLPVIDPGFTYEVKINFAGGQSMGKVVQIPSSEDEVCIDDLIDLVPSDAARFQFPQYPSAPVNPRPGQVYYNTSSGVSYVYDAINHTWDDFGSGANYVLTSLFEDAVTALESADAANASATNTKAPIASPTFTGTVSGITQAMVGLPNVDNTSDAAKPVSTAQLAALNLRQPSIGVYSATDPQWGYAGGADITSVCQAIINAMPTSGAYKGGTLFIPPGNWTLSAPLVLKSGVRVSGAGRLASRLNATVAGAFTWTATLSDVVVEHVNVVSSMGHVFAPSGGSADWGIATVRVQSCNLTQLDTTKSIMYHVSATDYDNVTFDGCYFTRSVGAQVPGFYIVNSGGAANQNRWRDCWAHSNNCDTTPMFHIESTSTGTYAYDNVFQNITGEQNAGGLIRALSTCNLVVDNVTDYDASVVYTSDIIRVGKSPTGLLRSIYPLVRSSGRRDGTTLASGIYDVNFVPGEVRRGMMLSPNHSSSKLKLNLSNADSNRILGIYPGAWTSLPANVQDYFGGEVQFNSGLYVGTAKKTAGVGSPEGVLGGNVGDEYVRTDGSTGATLYVKESGTGNTGWTAVANSSAAVATLTADVATKAPIASPTFTGTVSGITQAMVGLPNVDNTSDANKPVSTAQAAADALKIAKAGDTMSGLLNLAAGGAGVGGIRVGGDVDVYRSAADVLRTDDSLWVIRSASTYISRVSNTNASGIGQWIEVLGASNIGLMVGIQSEPYQRLHIFGDGKIMFGSGAISQDTNLYRSAADTLATDDDLSVRTSGGSAVVAKVGNVGPASQSGVTLGTDVNLYRSAANVLATDDRFDAGGGLKVIGNVGFYGAAIQPKPTISGSRGGNAALADLLTKLATLGLITDGTSA